MSFLRDLFNKTRNYGRNVADDFRVGADISRNKIGNYFKPVASRSGHIRTRDVLREMVNPNTYKDIAPSEVNYFKGVKYAFNPERLANLALSYSKDPMYREYGQKQLLKDKPSPVTPKQILKGTAGTMLDVYSMGKIPSTMSMPFKRRAAIGAAQGIAGLSSQTLGGNYTPAEALKESPKWALYGAGGEVAMPYLNKIALGKGGVSKTLSGIRKQFVRDTAVSRLANTMDKKLADIYTKELSKTGERIGNYYKPKTKQITESIGSFLKREKVAPMEINNYKMTGNVVSHYDPNNGKLLSWSTDNPNFAKGIQEGKIQLGLSTREVKPSEANPLKPQEGKIEANKALKETKNLLAGGMKERGLSKSFRGSKTIDKAEETFDKSFYKVFGDKEAQRRATRLINSDIKKAVKVAKQNTKDGNTTAIELINEYMRTGNFDAAKKLYNIKLEQGTVGGQASQAWSQIDKTSPLGITNFARKEIAKFNKLNPNKQLTLDENKLLSFQKRAIAIEKIKDKRLKIIEGHKLLTEVENLIPTDGWKQAAGVWKAGLLTKPSTHLRNIVANVSNLAAETASDYPASLADKVMALRTGKRAKTPGASALFEGAKSGVKSAIDYVKYNIDPRVVDDKTLRKFNARRINYGTSKIGKFLKAYTDTVYKALGGADKPFYHAGLKKSLLDQAQAEAINIGKKGNKAFINNLVNNPTEEMAKQAAHDAEVAVFQQNNLAASLIDDAKRKLYARHGSLGFASDLLVPFTQVPTNVAATMAAYSPYGLTKGLGRGIGVMINKGGLQRQAAEEIGKGTIGTFAIAPIGY